MGKQASPPGQYQGKEQKQGQSGGGYTGQDAARAVGFSMFGLPDLVGLAKAPGMVSDWAGGLDPSMPDAPSYAGAAEQQAGSSQANTLAQTQANRPNQSNTFATSQWVQNPDGSWTQRSGLTPEMQAKFDSMGELDPSLFAPVDDGTSIREKTTDSAYGAAVRRLDPQWAQRENQTRARLANQGLDPNSEAARGADSQLSAGRNDAYSSAMANAIGEGNRAGSAAFQNNLMARQQALANALRQRYMPFEDAQQAMGLYGQQGFNQAGRADSTQYLPASMAQWQTDLERRNQQQAEEADKMRGWFDLLKGGYNMGKPFSF